MKLLLKKISSLPIVKDSFWSVFGNAIGYVFLLVAGIAIARIIGKNEYGGYGIVKTAMFLLSYISTLGLGITTTRYITIYIEKHTEQISDLIKVSLIITFITGLIICVCIELISQPLSEYIGYPDLVLSFHALGLIIIARALLTTSIGILSGFRDFKIIASSNVIAGVIMLGCSIPLSYYWGLDGAVSALLISQVSQVCILLISIKKHYNKYNKGTTKFNKKTTLIYESIPIGLQDASNAICSWLGTLLLAKLSSIGSVGIYTAACQWQVIALYIPSVLTNVMLTYLTKTQDKIKQHVKLLSQLVIFNCIIAFVIFLIIHCFSGFITSIYGNGFESLKPVLNIIVLGTVFNGGSIIFQTELISLSKSWIVFIIRFLRDILSLIIAVYLMTSSLNIEGPMSFAYSSLILSIIYFPIMGLLSYHFIKK